MKTHPITFAHRGASAHAPENTLEAFRLALEMGAGGLETDAWLTEDGIPALVHDRFIHRSGAGIDACHRCAADLAPYAIPTLPELYRNLGVNFELSIDIQHPPVALPVIEAARQAGAEARLWLCHSDTALLAGLRAHSPGVHLVHSTSRDDITLGFANHLRRLSGSGIEVINLRWWDWTPEWVDSVHSAGLKAFAWDAQQPEIIQHLLVLGVDALYSDHPDRLSAALERG